MIHIFHDLEIILNINTENLSLKINNKKCFADWLFDIQEIPKCKKPIFKTPNARTREEATLPRTPRFPLHRILLTHARTLSKKKKKVRCCLVLPQVYQEALFFTIQILTQASCKVEQANPLQRPNLCLPNHLPSAWHTRGSASLSNGSKAIALPHYCVECQTANTPLSLSQFKQQIPGYLHCVVAPSNSFTYSLVSFSPSHPNARWKPK